MENDVTPFIPRNPGDLLSAGDWNQVQIVFKKYVKDQIATAVAEISSVPHADDADKLEGKTLEEIEQDILRQVLEEVREKTGTYQRIFKRLELCKPRIITHDLKACPLVDVYQLDYFQAVVASGETETDQSAAYVNFFLYHERTEKRIRVPGKQVFVDIEVSDEQPSRVRWADLLTLYQVPYTDQTDLDELEVGFWNAFFKSPPNDDFEPSQYGHSPWFEKCCGERRTVEELKNRQDWDRIYMKWLPRKTVNLSYAAATSGSTQPSQPATQKSPCSNTPAPTQIQVIQYDLDTIGLQLIDVPIYQDFVPEQFKKELKIMLLLKV
jgi:hypothetical protein